MKIEIDETRILLTPENKIDIELLHNAQYRLINSSQLIGKLPEEPKLLLTLGPDYLANNIKAEAIS